MSAPAVGNDNQGPNGIATPGLKKGAPPKLPPKAVTMLELNRPKKPAPPVPRSPEDSQQQPQPIGRPRAGGLERSVTQGAKLPNVPPPQPQQDKPFRKTVVIPNSSTIMAQGNSQEKGEAGPQATEVVDPSDPNAALKLELESEIFQKIDVQLNTKRDNIANEIMTSEQSYLRSLIIMNELFRKPMLAASRKGELDIPEDTIQEIFSRHLEDIIRLSRTLLIGLRERLKSWSDKQLIGDVMNDLTPFLKMYTQYTGNYERAIAILDEFESASPKSDFNMFMAKAYENPVRQGQNLRSFLIMPIQRIPRYELLLKDLIGHTPQDHPDYKPLTDALAKLTTVARQVDMAIDEQKNRQNLLRIQKRFPDSVTVLEPGRKFLKEGELMKICRKDHQKRYFYLFNDMILYATEIGGRFINHNTLSLDKVNFRDLPDDPKRGWQNAFQISSDKKSFIVYATNQSEKQAWLAKLVEAIDDLESKKRTLKNSTQNRLSTLAPVWVPDSECKTCTICGKKFTLTYRRHHCRQCGQVVCGKCSMRKKELPGQGKQRVCDICYDKPYETTAGSYLNIESDDENEHPSAPEEDTGSQDTAASSPTATGEQFEAQYDYDPPPSDSGTRKLAFKAGDVLNIIQQDKSGWWLAEFKGQRGWVPSSYLTKK